MSKDAKTILSAVAGALFLPALAVTLRFTVADDWGDVLFMMAIGGLLTLACLMCAAVGAFLYEEFGGK